MSKAASSAPSTGVDLDQPGCQSELRRVVDGVLELDLLGTFEVDRTVEVGIVGAMSSSKRGNFDGDPGQSGRRGSCQNVETRFVDSDGPKCRKVCRSCWR